MRPSAPSSALGRSKGYPPFPSVDAPAEPPSQHPLQPFITLEAEQAPPPLPDSPFEELKLSEPQQEHPPIDMEALQGKANQILRDAHLQAQQIRQQAREEGYTHGLQQARQEMEQAFQLQVLRLQEEVTAFLNQLQQRFEAYLQSTEPQVLELVMEIARKVVRDELRQHPEHVLNVVRDTLRRVKGFGTVRVRVHPSDLERVRQFRTSLLTVLEGAEGIEVVEDRRVEAGSCVVETEHGTYDARLSTQFEEIEQLLQRAS